MSALSQLSQLPQLRACRHLMCWVVGCATVCKIMAMAQSRPGAAACRSIIQGTAPQPRKPRLHAGCLLRHGAGPGTLLCPTHPLPACTPTRRAMLATAEQRKQWGLEGFGSAESLGLPVVGRAALTDPAALMAIR